MRKEVFYSLMAMTVVPVAANARVVNGDATPGTVVPDAISFDNQTEVDLDGDLENGSIKWCAGDVAFTVNQELVPGKYTFKAHLTTTAAAVWVKIPGAVDANGKEINEKQNQNNYADGRDIEVNFILKEATSNLQIIIDPVTDYEVADNKFYFLGNSTDGDSGLSFDTANFTDALEALNSLIDGYINIVFKSGPENKGYGSQLAKQLMNSFKEKVQGMITNVDDLTYQDFIDLGLGNEDLKQSSIYKDATKLFNQSTRIEAEYQANKMLKQLDDAIEASKEDVLDEDGNPTGEKVANPYLVDMANKVKARINEYKKQADDKTGATFANGEVSGGYEDHAAELDPKALEEDGFDVNPEFPPLKDLQADVDRVAKSGGFGHVIADALKVSYEKNDAVLAELKEMYDEIGEVPAYKQKAASILAAANVFVNHYRAIITDAKNQVDAKKVSEMSKDFRDAILAQLAVADDNIDNDDNFIEDFYALYADYKAKQTAALGAGGAKPELSADAEELFGDSQEFKTRSDAYDESVKAALGKFTLPDLQANNDPKIKVLDKEGKDQEVTYSTLKSTTVTGATVDNTYAADFEAYVDALNALAEAYKKVAEDNEAIDNAYSEDGTPNESGYDNREFFKEIFHNVYWKFENKNNVKTSTKMTWVNAPGEKAGNDQAQDNTEYAGKNGIKNYLNKLKSQLESRWGNWKANQDGTKTYDKNEYKSVADYVTNEFLLGSIQEVMDGLTTPENSAKVYKERGLVNAKSFAQLEDMLAEVKDAVKQLRDRIASSPIYSANPDLFWETNYIFQELDENNVPVPVPIEKAGANPENKTWKQILFDYETSIKGWNEALAKALDKDDDENFDNHAYREHSLRLMRLRDKLAALYTADELKDIILKEIEHFTEEGGVIDQQEAVYAEVAAEDNYNSWVDHLGAADGALAKLADRLDIDRNGGADPRGYKEIDPDGLLDPYFVGYDQPGADGKLDGKISDDELVNFKDWQYIQDYRRLSAGNPEALNADKKRVFEALLNSFDKKLTEAQAIFDKWVTDADNAIEGKAKADWTKADYEKANVELGKANEMIKEVNDKLKNEFEQPLVQEIKAQREYMAILAIIDDKSTKVDEKTGFETNASNMSRLAYKKFTDGKWFQKWDNGRIGVSNVKMKDCTNLIAAFKDLADQLLEGGPEDQEAYDEAKAALHPKDLPLYERLEAIYADGLQLRKALNEAYLQGNPDAQWKASLQAQYKAIEDAIKAWVTDCGEEEEDIQANAEALNKLKDLLDANLDGDYDWSQLIQTDGAGDPILDEDGNFQMVDLMTTPGILEIIKNDKKAMSAGKVENMLEPVTYNEDGTVTNLRTFEKQLASPEQLEGIEPTEFVAKARALREAAENAVGGELYERMKSFVEKLSRLNKARELDDNLNDLKKEFSNFAENILNIDNHAKENKAQFDAMTAIAKDMENQWDEAKKYVDDNMSSAAAYDQFNQALNNAKNSNIVPFEEKIKKDYEEGHAWQDGGTVNEDPKAERINTKKEEADMGVAAGVALTQALDLLTGENNATVAEANAAAYKTFEANYAQATKEYYMLVDKLEQLKNLDLDTELYGDKFNKDDAEALAATINEYLFGTATEKPKDAIDRIFREGTQEVAAANATKPVTAWSNDKSAQLSGFIKKFEEYLGAIDQQIDNAIADWADYAGQVYNSASYDLQTYAIYRATFRPIDNMPTKTKEEKAAKEAALKTAVLDLIKANASYKGLYDNATEVDQLIKVIKDSKKAKLGYTALLDVNALYDEIKAMEEDDYFEDGLADGQDAEAAKDGQFFIDYAQNHLFGEEGDKAVLEALDIALDESIDGEKTFEEIEEDFLNLVKFENKDGELEDIEVTTVNHDPLIAGIQQIVGFYTEKKDDKGVKTGVSEWVDDAADCAWVHQIKANYDGQAQAMATIATLIENTQAAWDEIKDFQVAPQFAEQAIYNIQLALYKAEQEVTDPNFIVSTKSVKNTMKKLVQQFGTVIITDADSKKLEDYTAVLGTMDAEANILPEFVDAAYQAEIEHLKADVNALRAEYKKFTEAGNEDGGHNAIIEGLWTEVNEAVSKKIYEKVKVKVGDKEVEKTNFKEWERTDLVAIQAKIEAEYKALRAANGTAIDAEAFVADLNKRLADAAANKVEDAYAAGAPDVTIAQQILEGLIGGAQTAIEGSKDVDYEREKLEAMVQNAEKAIVARDNMAAKWTAFKEKYDDQLAAILDKVQDSQDAVNEWVDEEYDLAASEASAPIYAEAIAKGEEFATLFNEILGEYKIPVSAELTDLYDEYTDLIEEAEDAAADFDLTNRLAALNQQLNVLKNKAENGVYSEDYLDDNNVDAKIQNIEDAIAQLLVDLEDFETTVGTTEPGESYAELLERIEDWILDDPDTEEDETELIGGIQKDLDDLAEILGSNVLGDMNNDGKVTLADAKIIADIALEKAEMPLPGTDDFLHADVNEDGIIDITDASAAVNIYFYGNPEGINYWIPEEARNAENVKEAVNVTATKTAEGLTRLAISLDNAQAYTAFQMDLQLAEGMKLVAAHMSDRANSQYLMTNELDGTLRIAALSLKNEAFAGNNGDVLYLDFEVAEGAADDFARFQNVFFVTKNAKKVNFELGGITPTGIQSANAETALGQKFYDLSGRVKNSLKKGVNIVKDAAGNVKKVIVK